MNIGIIGLGKMGTALVASWQKKGHQIYALQHHQKNKIPGITYITDLQKLEFHASIIVLSVKPHDLPNACQNLTGKKKYISIAAGITTNKISEYTRAPSIQIARVMPNLAARYGHGIHFVYCQQEALFTQTKSLFATSGIVERIANEEDLHSATIFYSCLPAFLLEFLDYWCQSTNIPFDHQQWQRLLPSLLEGTSKLLAHQKNSAIIIDSIASRGGITEEGLKVMRSDQILKNKIKEVFEAAYKKSKNLQ